MNFMTCVEGKFKPHKSFRGGVEGIKDESHSDPSFGIKWHNMAKPAMNDWLMKGTVRFVEKKMVSKFSNIMN